MADSPNTAFLGYYFVAFIDIVGQRDKLERLVSLPRNDAEVQNVRSLLSDTSEYVKDLRRQFDSFFAAASRPTGLLDSLTPEQRAWAERRKQDNPWRRGFSDSYFLTVPCFRESSWGAYSLGVYASLFSICGLFIWAMAMKRPFRGAVEVGLGTEIGTEEVYGPVTVRVVDLEREAGYPRIMVGQGLMTHLDDLEQRCPNNLEGKHTKQCIRDCRSLIALDHTGKIILDPLGDGIRSVTRAASPVMVKMVRRAYEFVVEQEQSLRESDKTLHLRYTDLRQYCESRIEIWNIERIR